MKYVKLQILVVLMIIGSFPGIYADSVLSNSNGVDSVKIDNFSVDGSKTIYVANNGTDRNDGLTPEKPKRNIEIAIDAANPGDTIRLAPGTYKKNIQINKNLTLTGDNQNNTIIDGQQQNCCIHINAEGVTVTIANLTIRGGKNKVYNYRNFGGGLKNDGILKLENSTIIDNNSSDGGGIYSSGILNITNVIIQNNNATKWGGGIFNIGTMTIQNTTIQNNNATRWGGGIFNGGTMTIQNTTIQNNNAPDSGGVLNNGILTIENSIITRNTAKLGGGIDTTNLLFIYTSIITFNRADKGGGILNHNNSISRMYMDDLTILANNTVNDFEGKPFIPA